MGGAKFHTLVCRRKPVWVIGTKMTSPALDRDFETHRSSQSSFPRRRESRRGGDRKRSAVEDYARRGACPPLQAIREATLVPRHPTDGPPTGAQIFILLSGLRKAMVIPAKAGIQWRGERQDHHQPLGDNSYRRTRKSWVRSPLAAPSFLVKYRRRGTVTTPLGSRHGRRCTTTELGGIEPPFRAWEIWRLVCHSGSVDITESLTKRIESPLWENNQCPAQKKFSKPSGRSRILK